MTFNGIIGLFFICNTLILVPDGVVVSVCANDPAMPSNIIAYKHEEM